MGKKKSRQQRHLAAAPRHGPRLEEIIEQAQALQEEGNLEEALAVLEKAPVHLQRRVEILLSRGVLYAALGDLVKATEVLEEAQRQRPHDPFIGFFLSGVYFDRDWPSHALQTAQQSLHYDLPEEMATDLQELLKEAEEMIRWVAEDYNVSFKTAEKALQYIEDAEREHLREQLRKAAGLYHQAFRLIPNWLDLRSQEAILRFYQGEVEEAIRISEEVLAKQPEDPIALSHLLHFYLSHGEPDRAETCAQRLRTLRLKLPIEVDKVVEALGLWGDDEGLYAIYQKYRHLTDALNGITLLNLGSAAANMGHPTTARRLWRKAEGAGIPPAVTRPLHEALDSKAPGPGRAQRYPTVAIPTLISPRRLASFLDLANAWLKEQISERALERQLEKLRHRTPDLTRAITKMLWEGSDPQSAIDLLGLIGTPDAVAEIRQFAFGQAGTKAERLHATEALIHLGELDTPCTVQVWNEETQEWQQIRLAQLTITPEVEPPAYSPEVWELIEAATEASEKEDLALAREKLEAAIALNPQAAVAHHNLAVILERQGDRAGAREHLEQALQADPHHVHSRCTLAQYYLEEAEPEAARKAIEPIHDRLVFTPDEWHYYQQTMAQIAVAHKQYEAARACIDALLEMDPEDRIAQHLLRQVEWLETIESPFWKQLREQRIEREREKRHRPTRPDAGLVECLERLNKDALIGTARAMPIPRQYNVRKALLIQDLAEYLTVPTELERIVQALGEQEQQALRDILEIGGTMDWDAFTSRYDHDIEESPYWNWHPPETVMGRLRMLGLLSEGTVDDRLIVLIPCELRQLLSPLLRKAEG